MSKIVAWLRANYLFLVFSVASATPFLGEVFLLDSPRVNSKGPLLECLRGPCFYKESSVDRGQLLKSGDAIIARNGGVVFVSRPESKAKVIFENDSLLQLSDSASALIMQGDKNLSLDEPIVAQGAKNPKSGDPVTSPMFYLGDLEVKLLSPLPNSKVFLKKVPQSLMISMAIVSNEKLSPVQLGRLKKWNLVFFDKSGLKLVSTLSLKSQRQTLNSGQNRYDFFTREMIHRDGVYGIAPFNTVISAENVKAMFEVSIFKETLKSLLRNELKNLENDQNKNMYIEN
jgi:hypothetical protein